MPFEERKIKLDAAAVILIQNLQDGASVKLVDAVLSGKLPPFLVLETEFTEIGIRYRLDLVVVAAEVVKDGDPPPPPLREREHDGGAGGATRDRLQLDRLTDEQREEVERQVPPEGTD